MATPPPADGVRLNKFLASCGLGSRRACEELITNGHIEINGEVIIELATRVFSTDHVKYDGKLVRAAEIMTVVLNKPRGYMCTAFDPEGRPTIYELLPRTFHSLSYVGRLDFHSQGLILLTNSGELNQQLSHPSRKMEKEYAITLDRGFDRDLTPKLLEGIRLEEGVAKAERLTFESRKRLKMVLTQGMNRQIRRMFEALDYKVKQLERIRIGSYAPIDLSTGEYRIMHRKDMELVTKNPPAPKSKGAKNNV